MSEEKSIFEMSDEDVINQPYSTFAIESNDVDEHQKDTQEDTDADEPLDTDNVEDNDNAEDDFAEESETDSDINAYKYEDNSNNDTNDDSEDEDRESENKQESESVNYEEAYKQIFKPFKANGKELQVKTPEEAIQLMQMGANYNKKMSGIKDQLPYLKMLEKNQLLDKDKLSYAIDLLNGDQRAIARLVKEHDLDLFDIEEDEGYTPTDKSVSKQEIEFQEVIEDLKNSDNYDRVIQTVTEVMDDNSKQFIVNNPKVMQVLETHMTQGIYDTIWNEVERRQSTGDSLQGLNSLEAYKVVGDYLNEQGLLGGEAPEDKQVSKQREEEKNKRKKQATSKPKTNPNSKQTNKINPLELSDEEFAKLSGMSHLR